MPLPLITNLYPFTTNTRALPLPRERRTFPPAPVLTAQLAGPTTVLAALDHRRHFAPAPKAIQTNLLPHRAIIRALAPFPLFRTRLPSPQSRSRSTTPEPQPHAQRETPNPELSTQSHSTRATLTQRVKPQPKRQALAVDADSTLRKDVVRRVSASNLYKPTWRPRRGPLSPAVGGSYLSEPPPRRRVWEGPTPGKGDPRRGRPIYRQSPGTSLRRRSRTEQFL